MIRAKKKVTHPEQMVHVTCQRCLKRGHFTYECDKEHQYLYRPSRTMQMKIPSLRQPSQRDTLPDHDTWDGDRKRTSGFQRHKQLDDEAIIKSIQAQLSSSSESQVSSLSSSCCSKSSSSSESGSSSASSESRSRSRSRTKT